MRTNPLNNLDLDKLSKEEFEKDSNDFKHIMSYANDLMFHNQFQNSLYYYNKALRILPDRKAEVYYAKADVLNMMKQYDSCFHYYSLAAEIGNKSEYYKTKANLQNLYKRRPDLALIDINKAIELDPKDEENYFMRGVYKSELKDYKGALKDMRTIPPNHINDPQVYDRRANVYLNLKLYKDCVADCDIGISINSQYARLFALRGIAKSLMDQTDSACEDILKACELGCEEVSNDCVKCKKYLEKKKTKKV